MILTDFWSPKWSKINQNSIQKPILFRESFFDRFFIVFWCFQTLKMLFLHHRCVNFHKIAVSRKLFKNDPFWDPKALKNPLKINQKSYQKNILNLHRCLSDFWSQNGPQNGAFFAQSSKYSGWEELTFGFRSHVCPKVRTTVRTASIFDRFWDDFWSILV